MCGATPPHLLMSVCNGAYLSIMYVLMVWYLVKLRDGFTLIQSSHSENVTCTAS